MSANYQVDNLLTNHIELMKTAIEITKEVNQGDFKFMMSEHITDTFLDNYTSINSRIYTLNIVKHGLHIKYYNDIVLLMDKLARIERIIRVLKTY
jgi:predicted oxidoreductase